MSKIRNSLAAFVRALPQFRGKGPMGVVVGRLLTDFNNPKDCIVTIKMRDNTLMRVDIRSKTERWAYWTGEYDRSVIQRLATCLQNNSVVFDVGANVGFYTVALGSRLAAVHGKLYAFEPVPSNFSRLNECVRLNHLTGVVSAFDVALGDEEGIIEMCMATDDDAATGNAVLLKGKVAEEDKLVANALVRITRLDAFAREKGIEACHLIKIDVEGAEVMFLRGGIEFLSRHRPIIYGEFNHYWLKQFSHSFLDVVNIIQPLNYRLFKRTNKVQFIEIKQPAVGTEDVLLCPLETPAATLTRLGVVS